VEWVLFIAIISLPALHTIFSTAPLNPQQWLLRLLFPPIVLGAEEVRKAMVRKGVFKILANSQQPK